MSSVSGSRFKVPADFNSVVSSTRGGFLKSMIMRVNGTKGECAQDVSVG